MLFLFLFPMWIGGNMKWRTIKEAPYYMVSDEGHVKSCERDVLTFNGKVWCYRHIPETYPIKEKDIRGYKNVSIIQYDDNMRPIKRYMRQVHRLVLEAFYPHPDNKKLQVNHINGDKQDNRLSNLEWMTPGENTRDANRKGKGHQMNQDGEKNSMASLREEQVIEIIREVKKPNRRTDQKIADQYGVTRKTITNIRNNITWKYLDRNSIS